MDGIFISAKLVLVMEIDSKFMRVLYPNNFWKVNMKLYEYRFNVVWSIVLDKILWFCIHETMLMVFYYHTHKKDIDI